jgi:hypothetical protein
MSVALALPLAVVVLGAVFDYHCLRDLFRADTVVLLLPRDAWCAVIVLSTPLGGLAYLAFGRLR